MYCQGEMNKSTVPFHIDRKGVHVSLDEIPAWVCSQCGESYFEENEIDSMQALIKAVEEQTNRFARSA
ncbi:MAG: YgiT-type zinc finger protein [Gammaproteobacteria bacterium]